MTPYHAVLAIITLERFAWYLFLGALALWRSPADVGTLLFWSYLLPLLGGLCGRKSLRGTVAAGAALLFLGYVAAALGHNPLPLLALGCGLFKPCLSALLGSLFQPGEARSKAFARYYGAIQVGSMPSTLVGGYLHWRFGWSVAFAACAAALAMALIVIAAAWLKLVPTRESLAESVIDGAIARPQWAKLAVLLVGATVFFAGFQQQQTTLVLWARDICKVPLPESVSTLNPFFALLLLASPLSTWTNLRGRLSLGLLSLAAAFALLLCGDGLGWLVGWYALATVGEVLVSPLGLDLACSLVPRRLAATATALWLLSMALGGKLAGVLGSAEPRLAVFASIGLASAGALWFWLYSGEKKQEQKEAVTPCQV